MEKVEPKGKEKNDKIGYDTEKSRKDTWIKWK